MKSGVLLCPTPTPTPIPAPTFPTLDPPLSLPPFSDMSGVGLSDTAPTLTGLRSLDTCVLEVEVGALAPPKRACAIFSLSVSSLTSSGVAPFLSSLTSDVIEMDGVEDLDALLGAGWGRDWGSGFLPHTWATPRVFNSCVTPFSNALSAPEKSGVPLLEGVAAEGRFAAAPGGPDPPLDTKDEG